MNSTKPAPAVNMESCLIHVCSSLTGYTEKAIERKIAEGVWVQDKHYHKAPDGRIHMYMPEIYRWIRGEKLAA